MFTTGVFIGDFSIIRITRSGAITEVENKNVDTAAIKIINQWRKREEARGAKSDILMQKVYTHVSRAVLASLRFSQSQ